MQTQVAVSPGPGRLDSIGLAAARAAQAAAQPAVVIFFGSRARGDWQDHSDIDLLVIAEDKAKARRAAAAAQAAINEWERENRSGLHVDIIPLTRQEFERCRRAKQHIAGQADTYGVVMSGTPLPPPTSGDGDEYPDHWPETARRIRAAERWLQDYYDLVESDYWDQQAMGFAAQQAVENALKGVLSARNESLSYTHNLLALWQELARLGEFQQEAAAEIRERGEGLFRYVAAPDPDNPRGPQDWLTLYSVRYRYIEPEDDLSRAERLELYHLVNPFVAALVQHIYRRSGGVTFRDVYPDGLRPWERHQPEPGIPDPLKE